MHAFSGRFSRASLEGISFNFFVCFILNVSIGSAPKRKNIDIQRYTRVGLGCQFTSNLLSCHLIQNGNGVFIKLLSDLTCMGSHIGFELTPNSNRVNLA